MLAGLDGVLLGGKAKGIVSHRMQHVETFQALVAAVDVTGDVPQRMAYMQAGARRIREHVQNVVFGTGGIGLDLESMMLGPISLPTLLNVDEVVFHENDVLRLI